MAFNFFREIFFIKIQFFSNLKNLKIPMLYHKLGLIILPTIQKEEKILPPPIAKIKQTKNFNHVYLATTRFCVFKLIKKWGRTARERLFEITVGHLKQMCVAPASLTKVFLSNVEHCLSGARITPVIQTSPCPLPFPGPDVLSPFFHLDLEKNVGIVFLRLPLLQHA